MLVQLKPVSPIGVSGVFICDNEEGNKMLKRMENPTHSLWLAGRKADTKAAYHELEKFLSETIAAMRPVSGKKSMQIMGLSDLVWIPENLMPKDADLDDDSENGEMRLSDTLQDEEGGNQVALIQKIATKTVVKKKSFVQEDDKDVIDELTNEEGNDGNGENDKEPRNINPIPPVPGPIPNPKPDPRIKPGDEGKASKPRVQNRKTEVRMRQKAGIENGKLVHSINIYPPYNIDNARLSLHVSWDDGYTKQPIKSASINGVNLNVLDNEIIDVPLKQSGTKIVVRFFDNIKHAIKLLVEDESN
jgi:hypothetical protein